MFCRQLVQIGFRCLRFSRRFAILELRKIMAEDKQAQARNLRKGVIIFSLLLAVMVAAGVYLWQQSRELGVQYDRVENVQLID